MPLRDKEAHRAYCRAYYYAHDGKNRKRRQKRRTREQILERVRLYSVEYRRKNKDKIRAYKARPEVRAKQKVHAKKWRDAHRDYMRAYYAAHTEQFLNYQRRWREKHRELFMAYCRAYAKANPRWRTKEQMREASRRAYIRRCLREMIDCVFFAQNRAKHRAQYAARRMRKGKVYLARPSKRVPDYCCRGGGIGRALSMARGQPHRRTTRLRAGACNRT